MTSDTPINNISLIEKIVREMDRIEQEENEGMRGYGISQQEGIGDNEKVIYRWKIAENRCLRGSSRMYVDISGNVRFYTDFASDEPLLVETRIVAAKAMKILGLK